ncbi:alcohol dehydrogenase, partial [Rhizobium leguminosarum bv. viciae]|nr:alcohol dehydrogenase [Rhizobium leguminosarum bv. viciae]
EGDLSKLAEGAMKHEERLLVNNPRELDYDQVRAIYAKALAGVSRP